MTAPRSVDQIIADVEAEETAFKAAGNRVGVFNKKLERRSLMLDYGELLDVGTMEEHIVSINKSTLVATLSDGETLAVTQRYDVVGKPIENWTFPTLACVFIDGGEAGWKVIDMNRMVDNGGTFDR